MQLDYCREKRAAIGSHNRGYGGACSGFGIGCMKRRHSRKRWSSDPEHQKWLERNRHLLSAGHILALGDSLTVKEQAKFDAWYERQLRISRTTTSAAP